MTKIFGALMCVAGLALGLYAGVWWAFVGGIMDVINEVRAVEVDSMNVAVGVFKIVFAGAIGCFAGLVLFVPGAALLK